MNEEYTEISDLFEAIGEGNTFEFTYMNAIGGSKPAIEIELHTDPTTSCITGRPSSQNWDKFNPTTGKRYLAQIIKDENRSNYRLIIESEVANNIATEEEDLSLTLPYSYLPEGNHIAYIVEDSKSRIRVEINGIITRVIKPQGRSKSVKLLATHKNGEFMVRITKGEFRSQFKIMKFINPISREDIARILNHKIELTELTHNRENRAQQQPREETESEYGEKYNLHLELIDTTIIVEDMIDTERGTIVWYYIESDDATLLCMTLDQFNESTEPYQPKWYELISPLGTMCYRIIDNTMILVYGYDGTHCTVGNDDIKYLPTELEPLTEDEMNQMTYRK
ncbi:MAG: hypothetical protein U9N34_10270 [Candidatus Cloacimonadota bacterium]|nr:hypothetical protein [Candidatus Cloacimonadota bacterium]